MATNEIWRKVEGFNNYEVSNIGRVRNIELGLYKSLRQTKTGYLITDLKENGQRHTKYVHRLVAEVFIDNALAMPCVNHKDEDKQNNHADNLEWCDISYNNSYGSRPGRLSECRKGKKASIEARQKMSQTRQGEKHWNYGKVWNEDVKERNRNSQDARLVVKNIDTGVIYSSIRQAVALTGVNRASLSSCLHGRQKHAGGYRWEVVQ